MSVPVVGSMMLGGPCMRAAGLSTHVPIWKLIVCND